MNAPVDAHLYRCPTCHRYQTLSAGPAEYRRATASFVRCPHDGDVLVYKGLEAER